MCRDRAWRRYMNHWKNHFVLRCIFQHYMDNACGYSDVPQASNTHERTRRAVNIVRKIGLDDGDFPADRLIKMHRAYDSMQQQHNAT